MDDDIHLHALVMIQFYQNYRPTQFVWCTFWTCFGVLWQPDWSFCQKMTMCLTPHVLSLTYQQDLTLSMPTHVLKKYPLENSKSCENDAKCNHWSSIAVLAVAFDDLTSWLMQQQQTNKSETKSQKHQNSRCFASVSGVSISVEKCHKGSSYIITSPRFNTECFNWLNGSEPINNQTWQQIKSSSPSYHLKSPLPCAPFLSF